MAKIQYGISNLHVAPITAIDDNGTPTYGEVVTWLNAVSLTLDPAGENTDIYADNVVAVTLDGAKSYTGSVETLNVPEDIKKTIFGYKEAEDGSLVDVGATTVECALMFECQTDTGVGVRFTLPRVKLVNPSMELSTSEDQAQVNNVSMDITVSSIKTSAGINVLLTYMTGDKSGYANYFDKVALPMFANA